MYEYNMYLLYIRRGAQDQEIIYKFQIIVFDLFGLFCLVRKFFEFELFRVGNSLFGFSSESLIFLWAKEQNSDLLFSKSESRTVALLKERRSEERRERFAKKGKSSEKLSKAWWKPRIVLSESLLFWEFWKSKSARLSKKEQITHVTLCLKSKESESLTVAL